jgi:acetolactate synthase-1/2/3 large subunit
MAGVSGDLDALPGIVLIRDAATAMPGLQTAWAELSPLVCVSSSRSSEPALGAVTAATLEAAADDLEDALRLALRLARARSRPVHLTLGIDPERGGGGPANGRTPAVPRDEEPGGAPARHVVQQVAQRIRSATRPVLLTGMHARNASDAGWVRAFAETLPAPVLATWKGRGVLADPHALAFGVIDATDAARALLGRSDLVVAAGVAPEEMAAVVVSAPVLDLPSPIGTTLAELAPLLPGARADWNVAELDRLNRELDQVPGDGLGPARLVSILRDALPPGAVAAFEPACMSAAVAWHCVAPGDAVAPALSRLRGFAIPAAIAAALVRPGQVTVAVVDTCAAVSGAPDLAIAARSPLPLLVLVTGEDDRGDAAIVQAPSLPVCPVTGEAALRRAVERVVASGTPLLADATRSQSRSV